MTANSFWGLHPGPQQGRPRAAPRCAAGSGSRQLPLSAMCPPAALPPPSTADPPEPPPGARHLGPGSAPSAPAPGGPTRRSLLLGGACVASTWFAGARRSRAALVRFPANQLNNRYFLVRAGESYNESVGEPLTNPVWKTAEKHGLSELGKKQVVLGLVPELERLGACGDGCWLWPSITQNAYQTAEVVAYQLGIGRSRIVPEYSFLDARGLGALETLRLGDAMEAVAAGDQLDQDWRPPKGTDGTPHESSSDVMVRMRQALSITETQYFGEDVLFVSPDSDCLSVLQAAVLGVDLRQHRRFAFRPGEVRPLLLSTEEFDGSPVSFACPRPPQCGRPA